MLVQIHDHTALSSLSIVSLRAYLNSHGWKDEGAWGERPITVFAKECDARTWEVLVPHRDTIGGFAENMAESVAVLATVEARSQMDVYYDVLATGADVIQIRSAERRTQEPLSLRQSAGLLNDAYNMLAASARSVETPRPAYRGKMSADVAEYLESIRPLPNDYTNYTVTLHSPVPIGFGRQEDMGDEFHVPFSRQATYKLAQGLSHTNTALESVFADADSDPFERAMDYGISANFCDSLAELARKSHGVSIDVAWAGVRPSNVPDSRFKFTTAAADILNEAAQTLRSRVPSFNELIRGHVVQLKKEPHEFDGEATILSLWDERLARMHVQFESSVYDQVINVFRDQIPVSLDADVHPSRGGFELRNPRNFCVVPID